MENSNQLSADLVTRILSIELYCRDARVFILDLLLSWVSDGKMQAKKWTTIETNDLPRPQSKLFQSILRKLDIALPISEHVISPPVPIHEQFAIQAKAGIEFAFLKCIPRTHIESNKSLKKVRIRTRRDILFFKNKNKITRITWVMTAQLHPMIRKTKPYEKFSKKISVPRRIKRQTHFVRKFHVSKIPLYFESTSRNLMSRRNHGYINTSVCSISVVILRIWCDWWGLQLTSWSEWRSTHLGENICCVM